MFGVAKPEWEKSPGLVVGCHAAMSIVARMSWLFLFMCGMPLCVCLFKNLGQVVIKFAG